MNKLWAYNERWYFVNHQGTLFNASLKACKKGKKVFKLNAWEKKNIHDTSNSLIKQ